MTKEQVKKEFEIYVLPNVIARYGTNDKPAVRTAWNEFTDLLCKQGTITQKQCDTWDNPYN